MLGALLGGLGCGEDVLVGNWQLRLSTDAGLFDFPQDAGADSDRNPQSRSAQKSREREQKINAKPGAHDRPNGNH